MPASLAEAVPHAPARRAAAASAAAAALPPLLLAAERLASRVPIQGAHGQRRAGIGDAFWQYRPYLAGDPAVRIDWRQSGRSDRLYIREREQVAARTAWLWRDPSPRMDWRSAAALPTKAERADLLLAALASLLLRGGERVGWLGHATPPVTGRAALARLLRGIAAPARQDPATLPGALILCGDFLADAATLAARRDRFPRATGVVLQVLDPAEITLPFRGRVRFLPAGEPGEAALLGRTELARPDYDARLAAQTEALSHAAKGWPVLRHSTAEPPLTALLALHRAVGL